MLIEVLTFNEDGMHGMDCHLRLQFKKGMRWPYLITALSELVSSSKT
jgi:hypothetical protein